MTNNKQPITIRNRTFHWGEKTYLMGILNVTPDSFSDGGEFNTIEAAKAQAQHLAAAGADIIDIGGQSTRPGAAEISVSEECDRTLPIIAAVRSLLSIPISIDTTRAAVAQKAIAAGADLVNDISGGTFDPDMFPVVAQLGVPMVLMHIRGTPQTMQKLTDYQDLIAEIYQFFDTQINAAVAEGILRSHLIIDPGIGFAKTSQQNIEILQQLPRFHDIGLPILVGVSRKSFIGNILNKPDPKDRVWGTAAASCSAVASGADILRIHDVLEMADVSRVADTIWRRGLSFDS
ncbi:dihydropteroate synthase [Limnofasciculus baicalensis]|uniref:Dihydropteroate synthase n=1 Tax=Limnofasciculus baicalensis BBK-W-15 TaxID=2699891 RepID=A0AAE3GRL4_9CYAN|nr:dihydropteroate synthase [Limnofasciculus baicalensis]MCP2729259.1 dihydropteroate synthase [Limnofasciculus baicalensis BBK-W-15]